MEELWQLFPIILTEHSNEWDKWYEDEYLQLKKILGDVEVIRISHIGSTAIREIMAKPTVDILIEVKRKAELDMVSQLLSDKGYLCMWKSDTRVTMNKGYTKYGFAKRVFHIHIRLPGDHDELYFRDYLNGNPDIAREYEELKLTLWKEYEHNRDAYTDAKTEFIKQYTEEAKLHYVNRYE